MTELLAQRISQYLVSVGAAKEEDKEIISYGIFNFLSSATQIAVLILTGLLLGILPQIIIFAGCFGSLKRYIGGAHASRHWTCLWEFTLLANAGCLGCALVPDNLKQGIAVAAAAVMLVLVLLKAPVTHPNNPKSASRLKKIRAIAVKLAICQFALISAISLFAGEQACIYALCGSAGGLTAAVTLLIPIPKPKNEGGE